MNKVKNKIKTKLKDLNTCAWRVCKIKKYMKKNLVPAHVNKLDI